MSFYDTIIPEFASTTSSNGSDPGEISICGVYNGTVTGGWRGENNGYLRMGASVAQN